MATLLLFLFILGVLIIVHEFGHFIVAKRTGVLVEKFSIGFGPVILRRKKKDTEYCISAIPLGGYVKLAGDSLQEYTGKPNQYYAQAPGKRFHIIFFGPLLNYILGFLFFWLVFFIGYPSFTTKVGGLIDGFGAKEAGIKAGDMIAAIDGKKVSSWEEMQKIIQAKKKEEEVRLSVIRDSSELLVSVTIKEKEFPDQIGRMQSVGLIGIEPSEDLTKVRYGFTDSFLLGLRKTWDLTVITYQAFLRMLTGKLSMRETVTGPLGIFYITSKAASVGLVAVLHLMAVLSISLAIFNLMPFPVLDGGHIFFLLIEKLRGKPFGVRTEQLVSQVGFTLIICLALFVTYNDILRLFGDKIQNFFVK
ncbi:MAG: RIP metalloprotease RseP [Candidatus Omnitrophota bacterium]